MPAPDIRIICWSFRTLNWHRICWYWRHSMEHGHGILAKELLQKSTSMNNRHKCSRTVELSAAAQPPELLPLKDRLASILQDPTSNRRIWMWRPRQILLRGFSWISNTFSWETLKYSALDLHFCWSQTSPVNLPSARQFSQGSVDWYCCKPIQLETVQSIRQRPSTDVWSSSQSVHRFLPANISIDELA